MLIDGVTVSGGSQPQFGVVYRVRSDEPFGGLRVRNVLAPDARDAGIVLENTSESVRLLSYELSGNMAEVRPGIPAPTRNW